MTGSTFDFDLAILGSGIACTLTLSALLSTLKVGESRLSIAVIEKDSQFWRGLPYGQRSSPNSLIITALSEFVPDEERTEFIAWLAAEKDRWTANMRRSGAEVAARWLAENEADMAAGNWAELYIPRFLYGEFAQAKLAQAITMAELDGRAKITLVEGEAIDVERSGESYCVSVLHGGHSMSIEAGVVLLAVGSPPFRQLEGAGDVSALYVNDLYSPSLPENLVALQAHFESLRAQSGRNLLIVGSNATSLETLYMISRDPDLRASIGKIVVLSTGGQLPRLMTRDRFRAQSFPRVEALKQTCALTAEAIVIAAELDVADLCLRSSGIGDTFNHLSNLVVELTDKLDAAGKQEFHRFYGMRFTRLLRRAGAEYTHAAEDLSACGQLQLLPGRFKAVRPSATGGEARLVFSAGAENADMEHPLHFAAVINCAGFEELSAASSSPLLANLVRRGIAVPNDSRRGFAVDEGFQTSPNVLVCGPLLAGMFNHSAKFWHVENVRRIHGLAQQIAPALATCIFGREPSDRAVETNALRLAEMSGSLHTITATLAAS